MFSACWPPAKACQYFRGNVFGAEGLSLLLAKGQWPRGLSDPCKKKKML